MGIMDEPEPKPAPTVPYGNSPHYQMAEGNIEMVGFIAQELEQVLPDVVSRRSAYIDGEPVDDLRSINETKLLYVLFNAVKELTAKVKALEAARV